MPPALTSLRFFNTLLYNKTTIQDFMQKINGASCLHVRNIDFATWGLNSCSKKQNPQGGTLYVWFIHWKRRRHFLLSCISDFRNSFGAVFIPERKNGNNAFIRQRIRQFCPSLAAYHLRLFLSIFRKSTFICFYHFCRDCLGCVSFWQRTHAI